MITLDQENIAHAQRRYTERGLILIPCVFNLVSVFSIGGWGGRYSSENFKEKSTRNFETAMRDFSLE